MKVALLSTTISIVLFLVAFRCFFSPVPDSVSLPLPRAEPTSPANNLTALIEGFRAEWDQIEEVPEDILQTEFHSSSCPPAALHAVRHYTSPNGYIPIITTLSSDNPPQPKMCTVSLMLEALHHFSQGDSLAVFRGMSERGRNRSALIEGANYTFPSFSSFSRSYEVAYTFAMKERKKGRDPFIVVALSKSGKNISALSCFPGEEEELHAPNSTFYIVKVEPNTSFISTTDDGNINSTIDVNHFPKVRHVFMVDTNFGWTERQARYFIENHFTLNSNNNQPTRSSVRQACMKTSLHNECSSLFPLPLQHNNTTTL